MLGYAIIGYAIEEALFISTCLLTEISPISLPLTANVVKFMKSLSIKTVKATWHQITNVR